MGEHVDDYEYVKILKHEIGHFIDAQVGHPFFSEQLNFAIQADLNWCKVERIGITTAREILAKLLEPPTINNRYLSDILSGLFYDNIIYLKFSRNGI